ncbi:MAG TPA: nitrilase-related carbon-nitrogen hydrolase [Rhizomicrobium sp.]|jgi:apolipoprotein N-acyltransferase
MIILLCAALSSVMFYLSQGLDNVWALAWIAPVPLLWLAYGTVPRWQLFGASLAAFAAGQVYMAFCYGPALIVTELAMMLGLGSLFAGTMLFARWTWQRLPSWATLLAFPALWTAIEYGIALVSPHGSWGALGYSQVSFPAAIQIAALFGLYVVTFVLCLFANGLALLARGAKTAGAAGLAVCAVNIVFGVMQLAVPQGAAVRVVALADEGSAYMKAFRTGDAAAGLSVTRGYAEAIRAEAAKGAHFFVTPEGGVLGSPDVRGAVLAPLAAAARDTRSVIVTGALSQRPARNMALAFHPDGRISEYDKRHLLLPFEGRFTPGDASGLLGQGQAVSICKDMDFPRTLRADVLGARRQDGIRIMAVPASDFMKDDWIHARMAIMRSVENRFAMVRSAFNGLETISDAHGRVIASARIDRPGMIVSAAMVPLGGGPTFYSRIGDVFAWLCAALSLGLALTAVGRIRASDEPQKAARTSLRSSTS